MPAPKVPNAAAIRKKYGGQKITFVGDSVGNGHVRDTALATQFTKDTGIKVKVVPHPSASDQAYAQLARAFSSKSSSIDVAMIDVVWPGAFAPYLVNLKPKLGKQSKLHLASIVANDTIKGKLVAMPWFGDYGILYYRTDLLRKYGYRGPPKTWAALFAMAKKIQDGERSSNPNFAGFVFQGNAYEGLTCNALEWIASAGGGHIIDNGKVTINNAKARTILDLLRAQIGKITPQGVTTYQEDQTEHAFDNGDAAFARNWPYQYGIGAGAGSKVKGKFSVTVLPHGASGQFGRHRRRLAARGLEVLEASGRLDRARPLHDEPRGREVRRDHQLERADDRVGGQEQGGREGEPVPEAGHRERSSRDAPREVPRCALQRGLEGRLPGHQPDPHRHACEPGAASDQVEAGADPEVEVGRTA